MARKYDISPEFCTYLNEKYEYREGGIKWRGKVDGPVQMLTIHGYCMVHVRRAKLGIRAYIFSHRLVWFLCHGSFPEEGQQIDHIDRDKSNNNVENLRLADRSENGGNRWKPRTAKTSQYKGVHWGTRDKRWIAQGSSRVGGLRQMFKLGNFLDEKEAAQAYDRWALSYYGPFAMLNFAER